MMPDLGKYTLTVLGAWGVAFVLIGALIAVTLWQSSRARRALAAREKPGSE